MNIPVMQIEQIPVLKKSHLKTFEQQGYTFSNKKFDIESGQSYILIYHFGEIVKKVIYQKDEIEIEEGKNFN